ncbi:glycosyltransferase family 32 protein [Commensalibacter oyaizuii]|uniref:Glycosyltransferase n=1 Tax=Commensalibacter oyaizuii TaxID=3043873 RepID=A0ABT6Q1I9_9PROT|nr:glycosyltransferase [Commensalibacter sp. TBRC 16381]MDI2090981.1 glycosyltransferase [Commensalibacter sp. TBRC 16381]
MGPAKINTGGGHLVWKLTQYLKAGHFSLVSDETPPTITNKIPHNIPKKIIMFWHDKNPPHDVQVSIEKIKQNNVGYQTILFDAEMARDYIYDHYGATLCNLYDRRCIHKAMQADFFRICYLLGEGGIYTDIDIDCHASLDNICNFQDFGCFLLYTFGSPSCIDNDFIVCEPNSPIILSVLNQIQVHLTTPQRFTNVWEYTGPAAVTIGTMRLLFEQIAYHGNIEYFKKHLKIGERFLTARAFHGATFEYKNTSEGNWKKYRLPSKLYEL